MEKILLIDKPAGITSHDVVDKVRRIFDTRRVGHAGTLDPFATGLLIIGVGAATKELAKYSGLDKTYLATARLGATSTTEDPEGEIKVNMEDGMWNAEDLNSKFHIPNSLALESALDRFRGGYEQTAPAFSAKKIKGKKLYELARAGKLEGVELPKKQISISELKIMNYAWPFLSFSVACSSGTYIRSLARDIGEALGCGAYLTELRRTKIGDFDIKDALTLDELAKKSA
ncbi:MAG: tRNA pseudouridine(55) synthase TruB [Patescibacteria group bacterium]